MYMEEKVHTIVCTMHHMHVHRQTHIQDGRVQLQQHVHMYTHTHTHYTHTQLVQGINLPTQLVVLSLTLTHHTYT